jgi:uncharacterized protein YcgL (UPF0745 family)
MKKILYLTYYFEPDLCAGSFRNSTLVKELARQVKGYAQVHLLTTSPNRYATFKEEAKPLEVFDNLKIQRIQPPSHTSGFIDQIKAYKTYFFEVIRLTKNEKYDLVIASSGRLLTGYLAYRIAKKKSAILYIDVRDIFVDTLKDVLKNPIVKPIALFITRIIENRTFSNANHINLISEGFNDYFQKYKYPNYSNFTNGIDDAFLNVEAYPEVKANQFNITYAGNIGEGQGLHIIIPKAAKLLGDKYSFQIIGDGGAKQKLLDAIDDEGVTNVKIINPVKRNELIDIYSKSHFLFMHLNDFDAFKKVLPSKVFELGAYPQPLIAGVGGYANSFVKENLSNYILFEPGDVASFVSQITNYEYRLIERVNFKSKFKRANINKELAKSMASYL